MKSYSSNFVVSKDGTKIHYRQIGSGEGLVLVHGAMMYSGNFMRLAGLLANHFTVYIPDRCGRGLSETHKNHSLLAESEDIQAILNQTNTRNIFGLSSGAIIVLQTAILYPTLQKIALYEPPLMTDSTEAHITKITRNYERAMAKQQYGNAFISFIKGTDDKGSLMKSFPSFVSAPLMHIAINSDAKKKSKTDKTDLKSLIIAAKYDNRVALQSLGIIDKAVNLTAEILLLEGEKSHTFLKKSLDKLNAALPGAKRVMLPNVGHIAAHNSGKPELVANELYAFFKKDSESHHSLLMSCQQ